MHEAFVSAERAHVGHGRVHVAGAHRVPDRLFLLHHGQVVLVVGAVEGVPRRVSPLLEEEARLVQVLLLPGRAVELHEPDLHLLVARRVEPPAGAEDLGQKVRALEGHVEQGALAGRLVVRHRGLVEVAQVVEFVAARDVRPARPADAARGLLREGRDRAGRVGHPSSSWAAAIFAITPST